MIETYAFLAMFAVQILAVSVLYPEWMIREFRKKAAEFPAERLAALDPSFDYSKIIERHVTLLRVLSAVTAVFGVLLMGWLFSYMQRPDWDVGTQREWVIYYGMLQVLATGLISTHALKYSKLLEPLRERKRKAILQRRGLFDFVSPSIVFIAVLSYFLYVSSMFYLARNPLLGFSGYKGYTSIISITLVYALYAFIVYRTLYSRKVNPLETHEARAREIGLIVRMLIYFCIAFVVLPATGTVLTLLDLPRWRPILTSLFFILFPLLTFAAYKAPPRRPDSNDGFSGDISQQPSQNKVPS